jgi:ABC-type glycerol-3-phosphate transport system permease component
MELSSSAAPAARSAARGARWTESRRLRERALYAFAYLVLTVGAVFVSAPFLWMVSTSLKDGGAALRFPPQWIPNPVVWRNYVDAVTIPDAPFHLFLKNTVVITAAAMAGQLLSASAVAFSFARLRWSGRDVLFLVVLATMMLPHQVTLIPTFILFRQIGWVDSPLPLIVPYFFGGGAFYIFLFRQFFMTIPLEMDDAARIDGCGVAGLYWRIVLPLAKPALATAAIFSFIGHWNEFLGPLIYLNATENYTLALGLRILQTSGTTFGGVIRWHLLMAASLMVMSPILVLFFVAQKYFIQGVVVSGVKG